jgi:outer membrane protein assembly factor BamB
MPNAGDFSRYISQKEEMRLRVTPKQGLGISILVVILAVSALAYYCGATTANGPSGAITTVTVSWGTSSFSNQAAGDWPTYHRDLSRSGFEPNIAPFKSVQLNWKSVTLDGDVYAEPLIVEKNLIVATENDSLYELNADTGQVIWRDHFGTPVIGGALPCGDIDPSGITSTPVVDLTRRAIFVVGFLQLPLHHELFAVDLDTGKVKFHIPIDPPGADPTVEQQRSALALSGGYVYVAYGGLFGDCGPYHGWVAAAKADGSEISPGGGYLLSYQVPTGRAGGIWGPSGIAVDSSGYLFVATGNSDSSSVFDFGDSVIKLSPELKLVDYFAPSDWAELNVGDRDLGSTGPILLESNFIFQIGKDGTGYLLDANKLGGIGGQLFSAHVCQFGGAYGGLAYSSRYLLIPCRGGMVALEPTLGSNPSFTIAWRGPAFDPGPPIIAGNAAWTVDVRNGIIYALDLKSGQTLFHDRIGSVTHFNSLAAGDGQVFVSASRQVIAYVPQKNNNDQSYGNTHASFARLINSQPYSSSLQTSTQCQLASRTRHSLAEIENNYVSTNVQAATCQGVQCTKLSE